MFHFYSLFSKAQFPTGPAEAPGETDWVCVLLHSWTWTSTRHAAMWTTVDRICASHSVTHLFCSICFIRRRLEIQMLRAWAVGQWQSTCLACGSPRVSSPAMFKKKKKKSTKRNASGLRKPVSICPSDGEGPLSFCWAGGNVFQLTCACPGLPAAAELFDGVHPAALLTSANPLIICCSSFFWTLDRAPGPTHQAGLQNDRLVVPAEWIALLNWCQVPHPLFLRSF